MKVILSRKGFDSSSGGKASPIVDGQMLSIPIPEGWSGDDYDDIQFLLPDHSESFSYGAMMRDLGIRQFTECHLDPDIRKDLKEDRPLDWIPALGQSGAAASELKNVEEGDLFLFFGTFRNARYNGKHFEYITSEKDEFHAIWGFMEVGDIYRWPEDKWEGKRTVSELPIELQDHPHWRTDWIKDDKNVLFAASKARNAGTYSFNDQAKLSHITHGNKKKSWWKPIPGLEPTTARVKPLNKYNEGFWDSGGRGQEFIFNVTEKESFHQWRTGLIKTK